MLTSQNDIGCICATNLTNHTNFHLQHVLSKLNNHIANQDRFSYKTNIGVQHQFVPSVNETRRAFLSFEIANSAADSQCQKKLAYTR